MHNFYVWHITEMDSDHKDQKGWQLYSLGFVAKTSTVWQMFDDWTIHGSMIHRWVAHQSQSQRCVWWGSNQLRIVGQHHWIVHVCMDRERERGRSADLFQSASLLAYNCKPPIRSNPVDCNQQYSQYLLIHHPAECDLLILQNARSLSAAFYLKR